jgi:hypothetical protein
MGIGRHKARCIPARIDDPHGPQAQRIATWCAERTVHNVLRAMRTADRRHDFLAAGQQQQTAALVAGLAGERRRRAVIQMASSLRNLGNPQEAFTLLTAEAEAASDDLDGAVATFLALALVDLGREREAVAVALTALAKHLPRYNQSVARYAQQLTGKIP